MPDTRKALLPAIAILGAGLFAVGFRLIGLNFISKDMSGDFILWYGYLAQNRAALGQGFASYTPVYLYLLTLITYTGPFIPKVIGIKLIPIFFDGLSAVMVYKLVELKYGKTRRPLFAALAFLLLPSVILNSSVWGQVDSIYTFFLLACLVFLLKGKIKSALIFFSIALTFKLQAVFFIPFLAVLSLRRIIPWRWYFFVPLVYLVLAFPAILAGRAWSDVLMIYSRQADTFVKWSMYAPNPYLFVPGSVDQANLPIFLLIAGLLIAVWIWLAVRRSLADNSAILICALASVSVVPYVLPRMHERYFYPLDVLALVIAFYQPKLWFLPVLSQISSILTYSLYLFGGDIFVQLVSAFFLTTAVVWLILKEQLSGPVFRAGLGSAGEA
jgi:Gpi18-like mannosyltransferase